MSTTQNDVSYFFSCNPGHQYSVFGFGRIYIVTGNSPGTCLIKVVETLLSREASKSLSRLKRSSRPFAHVCTYLYIYKIYIHNSGNTFFYKSHFCTIIKLYLCKYERLNCDTKCNQLPNIFVVSPYNHSLYQNQTGTGTFRLPCTIQSP